MTFKYLTIHVGDQAYGLQTSSPGAAIHFSRAYAACLGSAAEETGRFVLQRSGPAWRLRSDGTDFAHGLLGEVMRLLDWELQRRAVKQDTRCAAFHAAWVARGRQAAMLAGEGGCGKSRLCLQLLGRGFRCGAEDVTFLHGDRLKPFPRAIQLRRDDPVLQGLDPARVFPGCDGRVCVEVADSEAAPEMDAGKLVVAFLQPSASGDGPQPLTPLQGLQRLFRLCHRLDRVTRPMFETFAALAAGGRMFVLPRECAADNILKVLETGDD